MTHEKFLAIFESLRAKAAELVEAVPGPALTTHRAEAVRASCAYGIAGVPRAQWPKVGGPEWQAAAESDRTRDLWDLADCKTVEQFRRDWYGACGALVGDRPYGYAERLIAHFEGVIHGICPTCEARLFNDPIPADADVGSLRDLLGHSDRDEPPWEPDDDPAT
jgi:hypothetical protein